MLVTSYFLLSLMCSYMPCDQKHGDPSVAESFNEDSKPRKYRFTRSGPTFQDGPANLIDAVATELRKQNGVPDLDNINNNNERDPVVETKKGVLEGYLMKAMNGRRIHAFEGIPYAEPPVGHLRFRNPIPKQPWSGIRKAKQPGPICLQYHVRKLVPITGSEDCLTLSIYTPGLPSEFKGKSYNPGYPTVVWIHGGGFFFGAGSEYGPSYFLQEDVILVTINYRLGVLGFLSTGDEESPGNYGLKDQAQALKFISENIRYFGGDPGKIVLMGQSTGGAAVHLHMMSPMSKHLFSAGISSSGTALNHWAVNPESRSLRLTRRLAENVGCPTTAGSRALMDCFRATNPYFLLHQQQRLYDFMTFPPILFAPVVERIGPTAFLPDTPENMYANNQVARIPWISTQTTEEGESFALAFKHVGRIPFYHMNFNKYAPFILDYWYTARNASAITAKIRDVYFGNMGPIPTDNSIRAISDLVSDRYFRVGIHRAIKLHSQNAPTYASLFGFRNQLGFPSIGRNDNTQDYGVGHASDNAYYFNSTLNYAPLTMETPSYDMSRMLINLVSNFARDREPYLNKNGNIVKMWKPANFHGRDLQFLLIDNENLVMIPEPRLNAIRFWESLGLADMPPSEPQIPLSSPATMALSAAASSLQQTNQQIYRPLPPVVIAPETLKVQDVPPPPPLPPFEPNNVKNPYTYPYNNDIAQDFSHHMYTYYSSPNRLNN